MENRERSMKLGTQATTLPIDIHISSPAGSVFMEFRFHTVILFIASQLATIFRSSGC